MADNAGILMAPPPQPDYVIPYGADALQFGHLRLPAPSSARPPHPSNVGGSQRGAEEKGERLLPVVVVIHGGFWKAMYTLDHIGHLCQALTQAGYATWSVEYRRVGNSGGGWPGTFLDVAHGVRYVRELARQYPLALDRVAVIGHSAGGHLALWVAGCHRVPAQSEVSVADPLPVRGAVSLAGVNDLRRAWAMGLGSQATAALMGGSPTELPDRYAAGSPQALLPLGVRQVIVHGTADPNVPYALGQGYYEAARALGDAITLLTLPDLGHFEVIDPHSAAWPTVLEAVRLALH